MSLSQPHMLQLGVPHSYLMMSYQYKFQDEDQTKVKGSVKYVCLLIMSERTYSLEINQYTAQAMCEYTVRQKSILLIS